MRAIGVNVLLDWHLGRAYEPIILAVSFPRSRGAGTSGRVAGSASYTLRSGCDVPA